jgi:RNA polymerase sigma-70 factor, ECF subfamily
MSNDPKQHDDLTTRFRAGSHEALDALWRQYHGALVRMIEQMGGGRLDGADAEDLAQEAWIRAWRARSTFQVGRPFGPWITAIARNALRSRLRRRPPGDHQIRAAQTSWRGEAAASPAAELDGRMLYEALDRAMEGLTARRRAALQEELGLQQPTDQDKATPVARRKRVFDARRVIERELRRRGYL